ncbi:MAG: GNAT family N-acetyltransferase [Acidobacteria bacterium]|nr:GNAT family N-acetyltransferase [Acidobacteriota bacterium]
MSSDDSLVNPAWHALHSADAAVVRRSDNNAALAYDPDVTIWGAWENPGQPDWVAMNELAIDGLLPGLVLENQPSAPPSHTELFHGVGYQMVRRKKAPAAITGPDDLVELSARDAADMVALTEATEPGPFLERTVELGGYLGVRDGDNLVAMAGRRLASPDWVEISAVCTAASARRRGLARRLSDTVARSIEAEGRIPILHVLTTNAGAIAVYESLGFVIERTMRFVVYSVES